MLCHPSRSNPELQPWPNVLQGATFLSPVDPDGTVIFERYGVFCVGFASGYDAGIVFLQKLARAAARHNHQTLAGIIARPPEPVILVRADRRRQTVLRTKVVDRGSFARIFCENHAASGAPGG